MKNFILLLSLVIYFNVTRSQNTTEEEYNFMRKGYKTLKESGLDMKKGYYEANSKEYTWTNYSFTFIDIRREKDKSIVGTIIKAYSKYSGNTYYYAIPAQDCKENNTDNQNKCTTSTFFEQLKNDVWDLDGSMTDALIISTMKYLSYKTMFEN